MRIRQGFCEFWQLDRRHKDIAHGGHLGLKAAGSVPPKGIVAWKDAKIQKSYQVNWF
jgi:hypothetical protein